MIFAQLVGTNLSNSKLLIDIVFFVAWLSPVPHSSKIAHSLKYIISFVIAWKEVTTGQESALSDLPHVSAKLFGEAHGTLQFLVSQKTDLAEEKQ